jgi:hypothetical protein
MQEIGTTCVKDTCLIAQTAQSLAPEGLEDYPTSARLINGKLETQTTVQ